LQFLSLSRAFAARDKDLTIHGELLAIMEVEPLRLQVETKRGVRTVRFTEDTEIVEDGKTVDQKRLREGQQLTVIGKPDPKRRQWIIASQVVIESD
jgi:hypothetical protein